MQRRPSLLVLLVVAVAVQVLCSLFFVWDFAAGMIGVDREPLSWELRELMEIAASIGLLLGIGLGTALLARTFRRNRVMESQLREASGAFAELLDQRFTQWGLTKSERDVAWFTIKGLSIADIARLRQTSEGTVKAQWNAIYRKSGVSGRTQLLSIFIDDLMEARPVEPAAPAELARGGGKA
jgi:DNA-binding CsgD family transcriptional regulator